MEQTRALSTIKDYLRRSTSLLLGIPAHYMANPENGLHPLEIANWLHDKAPGLSKSGFRQYKAALTCYMQAMAAEYPEEADDYEAGLAAMAKLTSKLAAPRHALPPRTSSGKVKYIKLDDLTKLSGAMLLSPADWPPRAFFFLTAGLVTGLRPIEWQNATLIGNTEDGGLIIQVANAKHTNGRGNGETRTVTTPGGWMAEYTLRHMELLANWIADGQTYTQYYENSRAAIYEATRRLWPKDKRRHYSLYSGRHQFCANLKLSGNTRREIADLMGHASEETATAHYGKRRVGYSALAPHQVSLPKVEPLPSSPIRGGGGPSSTPK